MREPDSSPVAEASAALPVALPLAEASSPWSPPCSSSGAVPFATT
jgi:hypothetical protein